MSRFARATPSALVAGIATLALALSFATVPLAPAVADPVYPSQLPTIAISGSLHEGANIMTLRASDGYQSRPYLANYWGYTSDPQITKLEHNHWRAVITASLYGNTPRIETDVRSDVIGADLEMYPVDQAACQAATSQPDVYSEQCDWVVIVQPGTPSFHGLFTTGCYSGDIDTGAEHHTDNDLVDNPTWYPQDGPTGCHTAAIPIDYTGSSTPPTAALSATFTGAHGWSFDASGSAAASGGSIASYRWDFGDGQTATTTTATTTHIYADGASRTVSVVAVDSSGIASTSASATLTEPTLVVNSTGDAPSTDPARGCDTGGTVGTPAAPECTLRAAIQSLDAGVGGLKIAFALPSGSTTISAGSALPDITKAGATIDGTETSGVPIISGSGLHVVGAAGVTITGLSLVAGGDYGIRFENSADATVTSSFIGVSPAGVANAPKGAIDALSAAGTLTLAGNVLTGTLDGVLVAAGSPMTSVKISDNSVGVRADGTLIPSSPSASTSGITVYGAASGPTIAGVDIENNHVAGFTFNVALVGPQISSPRIAGNRIGVGADQNTLLGFAAENLRIDGVPGAVVNGNHIAGGTYDVLVSGSQQTYIQPSSEGGTIVHFQAPGDPALNNPLTGTHVTVSNNEIGTLADSGANDPVKGLLSWNGADDMTITGNTVLGHSNQEIEAWGSGARLTISGNTVGSSVAASPTSGGGINVDGPPSPVISQNVVGGRTVGISVTSASGGASLSGNTVGMWTDGSTAAPNGTGIRIAGSGATVGPGNTVGFSTGAGIDVSGGNVRIVSNRIGAAKLGSSAAPNAVGVFIHGGATGAVIGVAGSGNTIVSNTAGVRLQAAGAEVSGNTFGTITSGPLGNDVAIDAQKNASIHDNTIANSAVRAVTVTSPAAVTIQHNTIYGTAGGIGVAGAPSAPRVVAAALVLHGASARTFLVLQNVPTATGTIEVFGNANCADPEGRYPLFTTPTTSDTTRVISVADRTDLAGLTVMATTSAGTSVFSNCETSGPALDADGDGVPDVVEAAYPATTGLNGTARSAAFVADNQQWVALSANGSLSNVSPIDDPDPSAHPGATFPLGLIDWTVSGIDPGTYADVVFTLPGSVITGWWKYSPHHDPAYFDFAYSPIAGYGATVSAQNLPIFGLSTNVVVRVPDGGAGDDDGLENGSVHDPSAPAAIADGPIVVPVPSAPAAVAAIRHGSLARTGSDPSSGLATGLLALLVGLLLVGVRSRARVRGSRAR